MAEAFDLTPSRPLTPAHAVAAIIHTGDHRYLLQHRDAISTIFYPDHWGCFGGAIEPGESPEETLRRELDEELALDLDACKVATFGHFKFSVDPMGIDAIDRFYYDVTIEPDTVGSLRLGEGSEMRLIASDEALHRMRLTPYDGFALWLHRYQRMLAK